VLFFAFNICRFIELIRELQVKVTKC